MRKIISLIAITLFVVGCGNIPDTKIVNTNTNYIAEKPALSAEEGKICGGNKDILCTLPLFCVFDKDSPVGAGTCQNLVLDKNLDCETELFKAEKPIKEPVCAQIGHQKYTFLNTCEAERRGGTIVAKDFCKADSFPTNDCKATAFGIGMCYSTTEAWEFDGKQCVQRFITGCKHDVPFESKAACEQKCN